MGADDRSGTLAAPPFWTRTAQEVLADVASTPAGLSEEEARSRLRRFGPNEPAPPRRFEPLREIAAFLINPLVLILLCASAVSAIFGQVVSSVIVAAMVLPPSPSTLPTYQSQMAARRLREQVASGPRSATADHGGARREVVPGDVRLSAGDLVPGMAGSYRAETCFSTKRRSPASRCRGEACRRSGRPGRSIAGANRGHAGIRVSGIGEAVMVHTGRHTEVRSGGRATLGPAPETDFERGTRTFRMLILKVVLLLVFFVFS